MRENRIERTLSLLNLHLLILSFFLSSEVVFATALASASNRLNIDRAHHLYFEGKFPQAIEIYFQLAQRGDEMGRIACLNGFSLLEEVARPDEARKLLEACRSRFPGDDDLASELGWSRLRLGDPKGAEEPLRAAAKSGRASDFYVILGLAFAGFENGKTESSLLLLDKAVTANPYSVIGHYVRGQILENQGRTAQALEAYQQAVKTDAQFVEARPRLAALYVRQGKINEAWRQFARVAQVEPKDALAREVKERLEALLTKPPQALIPPRSINHPSSAHPSPWSGKSPVLKIGISTTASGRPRPILSISFRVSDAFAVVDEKIGTEICRGGPNERWTARLGSRPGVLELVAPSGVLAGSRSGAIRVRPRPGVASTIVVDNLAFAPGYAWGGVADRGMRGEIEFRPDPRRRSIVIINHVGLEEYLYGVLPAEMPAHWPIEALKAQAVIARTYALHRKIVERRHRGDGYDLCDEQHCQVYSGIGAEDRRARQAVDATAGRILSFRGRTAQTLYCSNCGGFTMEGRDLGWGDHPYWLAQPDSRNSSPLYVPRDGTRPPSRPDSPWGARQWLKSSPDAYCAAKRSDSPSSVEKGRFSRPADFRWVRTESVKSLRTRLQFLRDIGEIRGIAITRRNKSGRVLGVEFRGSKGRIALKKENEIRRVFSLGVLRSTALVIDTFYRHYRPDSIIVYGAGWGHGVGLCQAGAAGRAESGQNFIAILDHYFPGTTLSSLSYPWD